MGVPWGECRQPPLFPFGGGGIPLRIKLRLDADSRTTGKQDKLESGEFEENTNDHVSGKSWLQRAASPTTNRTGRSRVGINKNYYMYNSYPNCNTSMLVWLVLAPQSFRGMFEPKVLVPYLMHRTSHWANV